MNDTTTRPAVGISRCLLAGRSCHDGRPAAPLAALEFLRERLNLISICPLLEAGLAVSAMPLRLCGNPFMPRLLEGDMDRTPPVTAASRSLATRLRGGRVRGFVMRAGSAVCAGMRRLAVKGSDGAKIGESYGVFGRILREELPGIPMADDLTLSGAASREEFVRHVLALCGNGNGRPA